VSRTFCFTTFQSTIFAPNLLMKKAIVIIFTIVAVSINGQSNIEKAFSKSYAFEYNIEYSKAINALVELYTDSYPIDFRLGWLYYLNKDYIKSEQFYKKAIAREPSSIEARFGLVLPMSALGDWSNVLNVYLEILKIDPNNSVANYRTALIYFNRKDYINSAKYLTKVIKLYPFDYDSNLLYAKIKLAENKSNEAAPYLEKAIQYNPQSEEAIALLKNIKR